MWYIDAGIFLRNLSRRQKRVNQIHSCSDISVAFIQLDTHMKSITYHTKGVSA